MPFLTIGHNFLGTPLHLALKYSIIVKKQKGLLVDKSSL